MNTRPNPRILALFLAMVGAIALSLYMTRPPAAVPASAPETEFSAERAMRHVAAISQAPHPTGSTVIHRVRDYILSELTNLGLNPETQVTVAQNPFPRREYEVALAENIVVKIPGADSSRAILLIGHYDSADNSPGAADDGAAVATMLETARALIAGSSVDNDVILLFSDAEENTVGGAKAALDEHPLLAEVGLVLNFEMRGSSGPVYMFETGFENGRVMPEFARAVPNPASNSLQREVYARMPNKTDFTAIRDDGYAGFNLSNLEEVVHYHTPMDRLSELDLRTLQHHGSYALGLVRHFGDLDLNELKARDAVYFDVLGTAMVHYPGFLAIPLAILALLLFAGVVIYGWRRGDLSVRDVLLGFLAFLAVLVCGPGAVTLLWFGTRATVQPTLIWGDTYNSSLYILGFTLLVVAITVALYSLFRRKVNTANLAVGALLWWAILLIVSTVMFPVANFIFLWPLLFALIAVGDLLLSNNQKPLTWAGVAILSLAALPGLLLLPPATYSVALGLLAVLSLTGASLVLVSLLLGLLVPHLSALTWSDSGVGQWWLSAGSAVIGVAAVVAAIVTTRVDADHPRLMHLNYGFDTHAGEAIWFSIDPSETYLLDLSQEWTAQFFTDEATVRTLPNFFGSDSTQFTVGPAPVVSLSQPAIEILENIQEGDVRRLRLSITSSRGSTYAAFYIEPPAEVLSVAVNGKPLRVAENPPDREETWKLRYWGTLATGMELSLEVRSPQAIKMTVVERAPGLPDIPGQSIAPQPGYLLPYVSPDLPSHATLVSRSFTFD